MRIVLSATILFALSTGPWALASQSAQGGEEQNVFSGTFADALWTVLAFLTLLFILRRLAWKPMLNSLTARQQHIEHQLQTAETTKNKAEKLLEDYKQQGHKIIEQATEAAQQNQREIMEETRQESLLVRQRAQDDIKHAQEAASERLWDEAAGMMLSLGSEVLGRAISTEDNERFVREAVEKIRSSGADGAE